MEVREQGRLEARGIQWKDGNRVEGRDDRVKEGTEWKERGMEREEEERETWMGRE